MDEQTTLETALRVFHKSEWLAAKRKLFRQQGLNEHKIDEEEQGKIWEIYHELMQKAVHHRFESGDIERLEYFLYHLKGSHKLFSSETQLRIPVNLKRDTAGKIVPVDLQFYENEITTRWFQHVYDILVGRADVRMCSAPDCQELYIRKRRKDKKYCSDRCRRREWQKKQPKKSN